MKKLKIAIIVGDLNPEYLGGAEIHIVEIIKRLAQQGHKLHVFVGNQTNIKNKLSHPLIRLHCVKYPRWKNLCSFTYLYWGMRTIKRFLTNHPEIDILHGKQVFPYGIITGYLGKKYKFPVYLTVQNPLSYKEELVIKNKFLPAPVKRLIQELLRPLAQYALKRASISACVSHYSETKSLKLGAPKTTIVPNGVDTNKFFPNPQRKENEYWISTTSTLIPRNGIDTLIKAFALASQKNSKLRLKIAGLGPLEKELKNLTRKLKMNKKVSFLGGLKHAQVPQFLNQSHIFVRPSRFEGFGVSFVEAMACNVPVITCPSGGIIDFITHDKTGILVKPDQPQALAEAILDLIKDQNKYAAIQEAALTLVKEKYSWDKIVEKVEEVYYLITDKKSPKL